MKLARYASLTVFGIWIGVTLLAVPAHAQNIFGAIVGTVADPTGAVLPGATVTVTDNATSQKRTVTTGAQGDYSILSLPPGEYRVEVNDAGFRHFSRSPVDVVVNQQARVDVKMVVGAQSQQVVVSAAPPILQTDSATVGQAIEGKAVETLPLNGRNVLALVGLVPGVVPQGGSSSNLTGQNVFAAGNYQIGGSNANEGAVLVDGAPTNVSYGNAVELVMDQDAVQEFNVQTHDNTAEFGMYTGGVINMTTKSGTNAYHGTAYEYLRNTVLDANSFFPNRAGQGRTPWHQNQFGGNIGGPIKRNKLFFFADYQGYRQTNATQIQATVPTAAELTGDFSGIAAPIYDPLTTCGYNGNPACTPAQQAGTVPQRQQFSYNGVANVIPPGRFSTVARNLINYPIYAKPNVAGSMTNEGAVNNFSVLGIIGGDNDQMTFRSDQTLSPKQTMFERYTWWKSKNIVPTPYIDNTLQAGGSPEMFTTNQAVVGDTYVLNPTSVVDVHVDYLRWNYTRLPNDLGVNEATVFGWPSYMNFGPLNDLPKSTTVPRISAGGPISYTEGGSGYIFSINNNYAIASTYQRIWKRHTFKFGLDLRRLEMDYFQNNSPGGVFPFDNVFTGKNVTSPGSTGNGLASFELGYVGNSSANSAGQSVQIAPPVYQTIYYQGYFVQDTWQATNKLTATLGLRYEIPGTFRARHGWADTFNPTEINPIVGVPGAFDLVSSPQHQAGGVFNENWNNWQPRLGVAYRITNNTVVRAAWGEYVIPSDLQFPAAPLQAGVNYLNNIMVSTVNGSETPYNTLDNPYPNGLVSPPHRNPDYQQVLLGGNPQALTVDQPTGKTQQWNLTIEGQFFHGVAVTATYSGLRGINLPVSLGVNALSDGVLQQAAADPNCASGNFGSCFLNNLVTNPFYGKVSQGVLEEPTVTENQLLRPFPEYGSLSNTARYSGRSNYQSLELKLQKRLQGGGEILGSYTFSKVMTNAETQTDWLEPNSQWVTQWQDYNDPNAEYSLGSYDTRQRLVVSFLYPFPIGRGQLLFPQLSGKAYAVLGGWGLDGIVTFQDGFPLNLNVSPDFLQTNAFQGVERPNVVAGCQKKYSGSIYDRLGGPGSISPAFNTSCFTYPANFTFGNESRSDNTLRTPGIGNWDMSLYKNIPIHESMALDFRLEAFNVFNRVQFGSPNLPLGSSTFGWITSQYNNPRLFQVSGRFNF